MTVACPDCGTAEELPQSPHGLILCRSCGNVLERTAGRSLDAALAFAASTFILLAAANFLPLLSVSMAGAPRDSVLFSGTATLWRQGWVLLAIGIAACGIVLPLLRFALLTATLGAIRLGQRPAWLGPAFAWAVALELWAMPDVLLIGFAIGYTRVIAFLPTEIGAGGWCFIIAALLSMVAGAAPVLPATGAFLSCTVCGLALPLAQERARCPRCRTRLAARKPDALTRTAALAIAGYILYVPANLYPMTILLRLGDPQSHTILDGIDELIDARLWPLAIVVFTTSISIPLLKLVGLTWLLFSVRHAAPGSLVIRTKLHRFIDAIGRWSMIDVFTISIFAPLMQFGQLATVQAGAGAVAFLAVVVLTMFASRAFEPRLMWDAAAEAKG